MVLKYGRSIRIRGIGPWDTRLLTLDPVSVAHVLKNSTVYQKPWQSRRLISNLIGIGMLSSEGQVHKRQRRVSSPAFSIQNLRALVPVVFFKGVKLRDRWMDMILEHENTDAGGALRIDVCHWISRATFDVIGSAGFAYEFNAIKDETNELFRAYKEMFEVAISQGNVLRTIMNIYFPFLSALFPDESMRTVERCKQVIHRVASQLIEENKRNIARTQGSEPLSGKDILSLLSRFFKPVKSNSAIDLPAEDRISDEDILNSISTFMCAGADTSSLTVTWTLLLLAENPEVQTRLRAELLAVAPKDGVESLTHEEIASLYDNTANLPYLHNVCRESLREIWGEDAWAFK
ncbi:hypothetical protein DXG03_000599 [Asterophora parasitica]|uniref:Cytochrome P450 n=1 Tax=Asterophora parasitica TaxID=117018 RepID=A0A9P7KD81_9AGAR|nr:hypothetical protein DXG03_000599 [Asterophora parasitica]